MKNISFDHYIKSFEVFGRYSEEYGYQLEHLLSTCQEYLKDGFSILDIGAGTGFFARDFLKEFRVNAACYTAIEPSKEHINKLEQNLNEFHLDVQVNNEIFTPKLILDEKFDLIIMSHSLYWFVPDPEPYILNALNHLEKNGRAVMYLQTPYSTSHILNLLFEDELPKNRVPSHKITSWSLMDILDENKKIYDICNLPGTFKADKLFDEENKWILKELLSFFFSVESDSLEEKTIKRAGEALKMLSYKQGENIKFNLDVGAITVF